MKYTLLIISILIMMFWAFHNAKAARFDFSGGEPSILEDGVVSDTLEQSRFMWVEGQPSIAFDTTATAPVEGGDGGAVDDVFWFD